MLPFVPKDLICGRKAVSSTFVVLSVHSLVFFACFALQLIPNHCFLFVNAVEVSVTIGSPGVPQDIGGITSGAFGKVRVIEWVDDIERPQVCGLRMNCHVFIAFFDMQVCWGDKTRAKEWDANWQHRRCTLFRVAMNSGEFPQKRHIFDDV
jgi:hypothetical protein